MSELTFTADPADVAAAGRRVYVEGRLHQRARRRAGGTLVERIASTMLDISATGAVVDRAALMLRGFTSAELSERNVSAARDRANAGAVRQVGA
jgi:hypothetical protein